MTSLAGLFSWRWAIFSVSPCIWSGYQLFPLRIVATVEPNWLENVIDHVLRRICGGQLEQHM